MNRRGFFAALLAPLVVPWKAKSLSLMEQLDRIAGKLPARRLKLLNGRMNALYNQMMDNITVSRR